MERFDDSTRCLEWLLLGAAIGNRKCASEVFELDPKDIRDGRARELMMRLKKDGAEGGISEGTAAWLKRSFSLEVKDGANVYATLLEFVRAAGQSRRMREIADYMRLFAQLHTPAETLEEWKLKMSQFEAPTK